MKNNVKALIKILKSALKKKQTLPSYCEKHKLDYKKVVKDITAITSKEEKDEDEQLLEKLFIDISKLYQDFIDGNADRTEVSLERNEAGLIKNYHFKVYRKNKLPLTGCLSREEMTTLYRLYTYYGDNLTQRVVSRHFPDYSLVDFKRILHAFNITKASAPFPQHMIEECTEDELRAIQLREKENSFLRKSEEDIIKQNEKLLKQYATENIKLKSQIKELSEVSITIPDNIQPVEFPTVNVRSNKSINLYLSDIHLGAAMFTGCMYKENENYGFKEAGRRLHKCLEKINSFGHLDTINIVLMGDNIDCCGVPNKTARQTHYIPENMDPREQINKFLELMLWFIHCSISMCNNMNVYSVPTGNHGSNFEYAANKALLATLNAKFPTIKTTLWEEFYGTFKFNNHTFCILHGRDDQFMSKHFPAVLDDKTKVLLYEWLQEQKIQDDNIHIIKGDLHTNALSSCKRFTYRNVLSLFGASDYANYNYSRNSYGLSYDLFIDDNMISGTFENMLKIKRSTIAGYSTPLN